MSPSMENTVSVTTIAGGADARSSAAHARLGAGFDRLEHLGAGFFGNDVGALAARLRRFRAGCLGGLRGRGGFEQLDRRLYGLAFFRFGVVARSK